MSKSLLIGKVYKACKVAIFPILLVVFALLKVNRGIGLLDTGYSLGNYMNFPKAGGSWPLLTFVSNAAGGIMIRLPFGNTMLGMNILTSLLVAAMGVFAYRFFMTKMPSWLAFVSEIVAIGLCWAPTTILYHYMSYLFLLVAAVFIFRALAGEHPAFLVIAGVVLGIGTFARFPGNGLFVLLIVPLWFYGTVKHKDLGLVIKESLLCVGGYVLGGFICIILMIMIYGSGAPKEMIEGVFSISGSASDYTLGSMILAVLDAYWHGFKWGIYMLLGMTMSVPFFALSKGKYMKIRKLLYCLGIAFLFFVLWRWGMYNFKYYQKESVLQWGAIFLIMSIGTDIWMLFSKQINFDWKLIGCISLVLILVLPLGTNNYIWPILNSMFFIAPVTLWMVYRFVRWGRDYFDITGKVPLFGIKAMAGAVVIAFVIQSFGVGLFYVFGDGEDGSKLNYTVENNAILKGMKTTERNGENLSGISTYVKKNPEIFEGRKAITYGNIPGLNYYLDLPCALDTIWPDLNSYSISEMEEAMTKLASLKERPVIILSRELYDLPDNSIKYEVINRYIDALNYEICYINDGFVVFN